MSATSGFVEITCDGPSASTDCPDSAAWMDVGPASFLRARMAREDDWATGLPGGIDRCARCAGAASQVERARSAARGAVEEGRLAALRDIETSLSGGDHDVARL